MAVIVVSTKPNQISAAEMTPPRSVNALMCTRMPYSAQAMMISPTNTRMNGAAFAAPDLPAYSAWHCSMVLPCAAIHCLPSAV